MKTKRLVIVRHGKSSWKEDDLDDIERPLKDRATADADLVCQAYQATATHSFTAITSPAVRAHETAKLLTNRLGMHIENLSVDENLYTFSPSTFFDFISNLPDTLDNVMLFGHNPAITDVVNQIGTSFFKNIPTTGLVEIHFRIDQWSDIDKGETQLYLFPKNLR
ncbi:MAG: histidine phosphatase family protein [Psychroflexus sp.]|nr:histidine phosphatase family protein [Psychroflexus sp.]MDN6311087.1 histidine phosphatase family protein [Psychroflexus sp.]